jgi:hypothetical protein
MGRSCEAIGRNGDLPLREDDTAVRARGRGQSARAIRENEAASVEVKLGEEIVEYDGIEEELWLLCRNIG